MINILINVLCIIGIFLSLVSMLRKPLTTLFRYIYIVDLIKSTKIEDCKKILTFLSREAETSPVKLLYFLSKDRVLQFLTQITHAQYKELEYDHIRYTTDAYGRQYGNKYFIACKKFMAQHPKYCNRIEYAIARAAKNAGDHNMLINFAVVCKYQIKYQCRLFNTMSRMKKKPYMPYLADVFGRTPQVEKYLRY